jgi:hypothetical protein
MRCLTLLGAVLGSSGAHAALRIHWDCYLPNVGVDCAVVEASLLSKIPFLKVVRNPADADVAVTLSNLPSENGTRFLLSFIGKSVDGYRTEAHTNDKIPSSIDWPTATVRIMTKLERGLDDFMDQKETAEVTDGRLRLELLDPESLPYTGRPEQQGLKWYLSPSVGSFLSDVVGVGVNASGNGSVAYNYSDQAWRLQNWFGVSYNRQSQPVPGTGETASISFIGGNANNVFSWSFGQERRWSLGLLVSGEKNPQANYAFRMNGSVGLEFDLIPRQTVNQRNLGFRCAVGPEYQHYDAINVEGLQSHTIGRQFCDAFFSWHFAPIDLGAGLGETSLLRLEDLGYRSISASFSATLRVTDNFVVSAWINLQQINQAINEAQPSNIVYSDPRQEIIASMLSAVQQGYTAPLGFQSGLAIRYLFGNGSLSSEDQRWKTTSNLR